MTIYITAVEMLRNYSIIIKYVIQNMTAFVKH